MSIFYTRDANKTKAVQTFHDNIKFGPEYVCTCCDQSWDRSSVRKCEVKIYPKSSETLLEACVTTTARIDNTKLICSTCLLNLGNRKLLVCFTANKMGFLVKPQFKLDTFRRNMNFSPYFVYVNSLVVIHYLFMATFLMYQLI